VRERDEWVVFVVRERDEWVVGVARERDEWVVGESCAGGDEFRGDGR
jgi:hypothetical protein